MINKAYLTAIAIAVYMFTASWVFNHVHPWLSVAMWLALGYYGIVKINKLFKNL